MLFEDAKSQFCKIVVTETEDGEGGRTTTYTDGDTISVAAVKTADVEKNIAGHTEVFGKYTLTASRETSLAYLDLIKRVSDGKVFQIVSNGTDKQTPSTASIDIRQWEAVEVRL